jgi:hypothetical protein
MSPQSSSHRSETSCFQSAFSHHFHKTDCKLAKYTPSEALEKPVYPIIPALSTNQPHSHRKKKCERNVLTGFKSPSLMPPDAVPKSESPVVGLSTATTILIPVFVNQPYNANSSSTAYNKPKSLSPFVFDGNRDLNTSRVACTKKWNPRLSRRPLPGNVKRSSGEF